MRVLAGICLAALTAGALTACSGDDEPPIRVQAATIGTVTEVVEAPGAVAARASAVVNAPASGRVKAVRVEEGERVKAGDVLFEVDAPQATDALERAREADRQAAAAGSGGRVARVDVAAHAAGSRQQAAKGFAAARKQAERITDPAIRAQVESALNTAQAQYETSLAATQALVDQVQSGVGSIAAAVGALSQAQRLQTRAAVDAAQRQVSALTVRAPISGVVSLSAPSGGGGTSGLSPELAAQAQELLGSAGGSSLGDLGGTGGGSSISGQLSSGIPVTAGSGVLTITDSSELSVVAQVDETDILLVRRGVRAEVELDAVPGEQYPSAVSSIDPSPAASARGGVAFTVRLPLEVEKGGPVLRPGMSAVVQLQVRTDRKAVTVPGAAVVRQGARSVVWVVEGSGDKAVTRRRAITIGAESEDRIAVSSGLRAGERVVVRGTDRVKDGEPLP